MDEVENRDKMGEELAPQAPISFRAVGNERFSRSSEKTSLVGGRGKLRPERIDIAAAGDDALEQNLRMSGPLFHVRPCLLIGLTGNLRLGRKPFDFSGNFPHFPGIGERRGTFAALVLRP